jgi:hypothetical protein
VGGQHHAPTALPLGKTRDPLYRRLRGPQSRSVRVGKISRQPGFDPRTAQPVASRYMTEPPGPRYEIVSVWNTEIYWELHSWYNFFRVVFFSVISFWRYTELLTNLPGHEASPKLILWECLKVNQLPYPHTSCSRLQITVVVFLIVSSNKDHWLLIFVRYYRGSSVVRKAFITLLCVIVTGCGWARDWRKVQRLMVYTCSSRSAPVILSWKLKRKPNPHKTRTVSPHKI